MNSQHAELQRFVSLTSLTADETEAEICEELQFHLDMRTEENLRTGMSPEEARQAANQRFGDFDALRKECQKITLGPKLALRRVVTACFVLLIAAVVYQGVLLYQLQTSSRDRIAALTQMVEHLQADSEPVQGEIVRMPYLHLSLEPSCKEDAVVDQAATEGAAAWHAAARCLEQPWSDWQALGDLD